MRWKKVMQKRKKFPAGGRIQNSKKSELTDVPQTKNSSTAEPVRPTIAALMLGRSLFQTLGYPYLYYRLSGNP